MVAHFKMIFSLLLKCYVSIFVVYNNIETLHIEVCRLYGLFPRVRRRAEDGTLLLFFFLKTAVKEMRKSDTPFKSASKYICSLLLSFCSVSLKKTGG